MKRNNKQDIENYGKGKYQKYGQDDDYDDIYNFMKLITMRQKTTLKMFDIQVLSEMQ